MIPHQDEFHGPLESDYGDSPDGTVKDWTDRFKRFLDENRASAFIGMGVLALALGTVFGPELATLVVTALLYLAIVFVNLDLHELQQGQNQILELERRPLVEVADVDFSSNPCEYWISNFGPGFATHLAVAIKTQIPTNDSPPETTFVNLTPGDNEGYDRYDRTIPPNQETVLFEGNPHIAYSIDGNRRSSPIEDASEDLRKAGVNRVNYQIFLIYTNQLGEVGFRMLTEIRSVEIERGMTFQEFHKESVLLGGYERDTFPNFGLGDIIHTRDAEELREPTVL